MRQFVIPETFFVTLAEQPKLYSRLWFEWLSGYADIIFEPDFLEKINITFYNVDDVRQIWIFGVQLLRQGEFTIIDKSKKRKKVYKKSDPQKQEVINKVVEYLNVKAETAFLPTTQSTITQIIDRMDEGFGLQDFMTVIDKKVADWMGTDYEKFLRPITLFSKEKFENYLNAKNSKNVKSNSNSDKLNSFSQNIELAKKSFLLGKE